MSLDLSIFDLPTPVRELEEIYRQFGVHLFVKEDYLNHPVISGNKMRKLLGNLRHYASGNYKGILSFGGAHSNHLYAMAGVCRLFDIPLTMIVRGDGYDDSNETLRYAKESGVNLQFVDRAAYRMKLEATEIQKIVDQHDGYFIIPEGGSNVYANEGLKILYDELKETYDFIALSMGTGGTAAGLLQASKSETLVIYPALKGNWMETHLKEFFGIEESLAQRMTMRNHYHFGGYGKMPDELLVFINEIESRYQLPLDPVYTSKAFYGILEDIKSGFYPAGSNILFLHTGGLRRR